MLDDRIREEGVNYTQWHRVAVAFTPADQRTPGRASLPIMLLAAEPRLGSAHFVAVDMGCRQSRELGSRLLRYADRLEAESGATPPTPTFDPPQCTDRPSSDPAVDVQPTGTGVWRLAAAIVAWLRSQGPIRLWRV